jgi:hypothetical protein
MSVTGDQRRVISHPSGGVINQTRPNHRHCLRWSGADLVYPDQVWTLLSVASSFGVDGDSQPKLLC